MGILDFTEREVKDIVISLLVLSLVFAYPEILFEPLFFVTSMLTVGIAFIGHELSHRFVARKLGYHSEYVMWKQGLLMALLLAFISNGRFIFAAPGAVVFASYWAFKRPSLSEVGKIGIAGTVFNITLLYVFAAAYFLTGLSVLAFAGIINGWFAIFNLIPFGPLDGRKVMKWNSRIWLAAFALALLGFGILYVF
jgi:Zn-dependent protease